MLSGIALAAAIIVRVRTILIVALASNFSLRFGPMRATEWKISKAQRSMAILNRVLEADIKCVITRT